MIALEFNLKVELQRSARIMILLDNPALRPVALGLTAIGVLAGVVGTFAVVRRQSLQGDAISHAALPGVALAFMLGGRSPLMIVLGAACTGWLAMTLVKGVTSRSRIPFDTALAGALAVFFGFGLVLMTYLRKLNEILGTREPDNFLEEYLRPHARDAVHHGLEKYLFGQAAFLQDGDVTTIVGLGVAILTLLALFWKQLKLASFDRDFAASLGFPMRGLELLMTSLIVCTVVLGLQFVGVVLMSALLVAPVVAARQWVQRLGPLCILAGVIGGAAGFFGAILGHQRQGLPAGPLVVLAVTAMVVASILFAPQNGLVWGLLRKRVTA